MPSIVPHRRARDDEDEDHEEEPRSANKRARPNGRTSTAERHSGVSFHENAAAALQEHQPGAIVRVKLTDFVTYTAATFYPGPALNMVIGPNGTGKSTLVCAICLGLASSPSNLGRAKDVGEFVKHGASEAYIELELKGRRGQRNQIITTHIKKEGNKRTFSINGTSTTQKAVVKLANEFSIQIDNLCQFLPQDRVVEFAGLNPVDLLASTQRAAAPQQMIDWHEQLKKLRATQRTAEVEQGDARKSLTDLQKKQDNQRIDVERLRERAEVVKNISMLEKVKQLAESVFLKDAHSKAKDVRTAARIELADLTAEVQPTLQAKIAKEEYVEAVNKVFKSRSSMYERFTKQSEAHLKEAEAFSQKIKACEVERRTEKDNQKLNKQKAAQIQTKIRGIKAQMQQEPVEFDLAAVQEKGRELGRQAMELTEEVAALRQSMQQRQGLFVDKKERLARAKHDLEGLRTQAGQQANRLAQRAPDAAKLLNFVKEKGDRFSAEVFGPPLVECHVTNNQFTDIIESLLNEGDITQAFTVQNQADFKTLNTIAFEELRLTQISIRLADRDMNHWRQQRAAVMSDEQIRTLGIDGWALDYLAGPDPVLSMLCKDSHMHETPIMKQDHDDAKYNILSNMNLRTWFAGSKCYKITKRREYGISAGSVKAVAAARFWTTQPVDTRHEADLRDNIEGWGQELQELSQTQEGERLKSKTIQSRLADVDAEKKEHEVDKSAKQRALTEFRKLPTRLAGEESSLEEIRLSLRELNNRLSDINEKETDLMLKKGQKAIDYIRAIEIIRVKHVELMTASLQHIEAQSDLDELKKRNEEIEQLLQEKRAEVAKADKDVKHYVERYKAVAASFLKSTEEEPALMEFYEAMSAEERARTPEDLELEIGARQARLELLHEGDPTIIRAFEDRARQITRLAEKVAGNDEGLQALEQEVVQIRTQWEPKLDALVAKISDAFGASFSKINCAGEVSVYKPGEDGRDFENWSILIQVKFRENEQLSALDNHRQSGGERAVSTIFYLMALQTLSRAPFRVVDEINQGMDPRNERIVHERMVDIACGKASVQRPEEDGEGLAVANGDNAGGQISQYFLITPKLLTGLKYAPGMTVHCIASGEYMPDAKEGISFAGYLQKRQRFLQQRSGLASVAA